MANNLEEELNGGSSAGFLLAFFGGALVGAAAGILLAPKPGRESRDQLRNYIQKTRDNFRTMTRHTAQAAERAAETGRRFVDENAG